MLSFNNTEIAFADKSPQDLNRSYWLFKIIANNSIVNIGSKLTNIALQLHLPIKPLTKATIFKQFCGGENIDECESKINTLGRSNIGTILDFSVEGKESEKNFEACTTEIIATIKKSTTNKNIPFSVFKVTGVARFQLLEKIASKANLTDAEQLEFKKVEQRIETICKAAHDANTPVFIDAEETWIQNAIDDLATKMMAIYNIQKPIVYNTIQMYRKDRLAYLKLSFESATNENYFLGLKIVRGAYLDKELNRAKKKVYTSPIQDTKQNTDNDYDAALLFCSENIDRIAFCAATHNETSAMKLTEWMHKKNIANNNKHIYFAQLLGMSDHISYNLAKQGYNVAKYVPYGPVKEVLPYLIRRAQENTFVKGQTGRELSLIIKERQRRKTKNKK